MGISRVCVKASPASAYIDCPAYDISFSLPLTFWMVKGALSFGMRFVFGFGMKVVLG